MKKVRLFDNQMVLNISEEDWDFLCQNRLFSENPAIDEIQAEFVSGTGITKNKKHLWENANEKFLEYVKDLKEILFDENVKMLNCNEYPQKGSYNIHEEEL